MLSLVSICRVGSCKDGKNKYKKVSKLWTVKDVQRPDLKTKANLFAATVVLEVRRLHPRSLCW